MTPQEIFDTVARHLLTQNCQSIMEIPSTFNPTAPSQPTCMYRGPNGLKCAVGCLIPNDQYHSTMEGRSYMSTMFDDIQALLGHENTKLIHKLQMLHDTSPPAQWPMELRIVAGEMKLSPAVIDNAATESEKK